VVRNPENHHLVRPFRALRPIPERAQEVAAPPYDVLNTEEARALVSDNPWSFLHISKPEIDLPPGTDVYAPEVYKKAAENMSRMISEGVLERDPEPYYYIYRLRMGDHVQTGIVGAGSIDAYRKNIIRRHEFTRPDKEDDRVRQIEAVNAQTGPVFITHKPNGNLAEIITKATADDPAYSVIGEGGVEHSLWVVSDADDIQTVTNAFDELSVIYIADGHHRSAAASRVATARSDADPSYKGDESYNEFLIVCFPEKEVQILDYNRVVRDLGGLSEQEFLSRVEEVFDVKKYYAVAKPEASKEFGMYLSGQWYKLTLKAELNLKSTPMERLDISILTSHLLEPVLAISDPRIDPRIDFIGGIRGMAELEKRVNGGEWAVAFALYPTSMTELMAVADADQVMPPKSTWFEPKLADGIISLVLD